MNPARTFGPDLVGRDFGSYWVYVAGPLTGAIIAGGKGTAAEKMKAMKKAGIHVVESPAKIGEMVARVLPKKRKKRKHPPFQAQAPAQAQDLLGMRTIDIISRQR